MQTFSLDSILAKKFIGTEELRKKLTFILDDLPKEKEVVITQNGKPKGVMVDLETYLKIQELADDIADYDPKLVKRVNAALEDAKRGNVIDADEAFKKLGL